MPCLLFAHSGADIVLMVKECRTKSPTDRIPPPLFFVDEDRIPPVYLANRTESPTPSQNLHNHIVTFYSYRSIIFASKKFIYSLFANDWIIMLFGFYFLKKAAY